MQFKPHCFAGDSECNFDIPESCKWIQVSSTGDSLFNTILKDDLNWIRLKGETLSDDTGPLSDHTTGEGRVIVC